MRKTGTARRSRTHRERDQASAFVCKTRLKSTWRGHAPVPGLPATMRNASTRPQPAEQHPPRFFQAFVFPGLTEMKNDRDLDKWINNTYTQGGGPCEDSISNASIRVSRERYLVIIIKKNATVSIVSSIESPSTRRRDATHPVFANTMDFQ